MPPLDGPRRGARALPPFAALRYNFKDLPPQPGRSFSPARNFGRQEAESGMRGKLVVGNWKMNGGLAANATLLAEMLAGWQATPGRRTRRVRALPVPGAGARGAGRSPIAWGAQDVSEHASGAYTGEVSAAMLKEFGCRYAIVGHSERRQFFGDTDAVVAAKARAALAAGLTPIACVGETLAEREAEATEAVVLRQLEAVLSAVGADASRLVVAYEPVWAIGTGRTASPRRRRRRCTRRCARGSRRRGRRTSRCCTAEASRRTTRRRCSPWRISTAALIGGASLKAAEFLAIARA